MLGIFLFVIAGIELAWAVVVIRADPRRWDNRVFAVIGAVDSIMAGVRSVYVLEGYAIDDWAVGRLCSVLSVVLGYLTFEFAWSFPFSRPAPGWSRAVVGGLSVAAIALLSSPDALRLIPVATFGYFLPVFILTVALLWRNLRRVEGRAAAAVRLVVAALVLRWTFAMMTYGVARQVSPQAFSSALVLESTLSVLLASILIGYAVLSGQLFRVRGVVAELVVHATVVLAMTTMVVAGIEAVLTLAPGPAALRIGLFAVAALPLVMLAGATRMRKRLEVALDPRRAMRATVVDRILRGERRADPAALIDDTCGAFSEVSQGGTVRFLAAPGRRIAGARGELGGELAARLRDEGHVLEGGIMHVAVRVADDLHGALELTGGQQDRDTLLAAWALAGHLAVKLENAALFAELEESRRLATLGSFAAAIAHDIRTPLASISMNVQMLRRKVKLPPDDMEHFEIALEELARLNGSIGDLLDYAKPVRLQETALELREVLGDAARGIAATFADRGVALDIELGDDVPAVRGDAHRLRQVLVNLLDNAAQASTRGSAVKLRGAPAEDGRVAVEITDEGKGIAAADLGRIFEPFFTTRPDGTGLGLAIVQKLVRAHHGELLVRSTPGKGSTFTVLLPAG